MINLVGKITASLLAASAVGLTAHAATLNNTFDVPFDYVGNGIIGESNWDGLYMRLGDIPGAVAAGDGSGNTLIANTTEFGGGFFSVRSSGTSWSGGDNDGFFAYKLVDGDFDMSVENVPFTISGGTSYDNQAFHFAGLMVRAYHTNNSGAPFSTTSTNAVENSVRLWRFNEFNIDSQIRISTNGANQELNVPGSNTEITSSRFFRITRVGNTFTFYVKTNSVDAWSQVTNGLIGGTLTRSDWNGLPLQVGIASASFNAAARDAMFDNFELSGPNISFPTQPSAPSNLTTTGTNVNGALTFSWTKGNPANNSLVLVRQGGVIQHNPINGRTYEANSAFATAGTLVGGSQTYAVYNGAGSSVTVSNLGANNRNYTVAVYEYSGTGSSTVYNTTSPATNVFAGPGVITGASLRVAQRDIPAGGATSVRLIASFSTGETSDQTVDTAWISDDLAVAEAIGGVVSGISVGNANITGTFGSFVLSTNILVHAPVLTENFSSTNDFKLNGAVGTIWDGQYLSFGDVPGAVPGGDGPGTGLQMDSQITSTNGLFVSSAQSTWQGTANDGPFLFKIVPGTRNGLSGDFQAIVEINTMNTLATSAVGIMARLYNPTTGGPAPGTSENHVNYWKIQNGTTSVRRTQTGGNTTFVAAGPAAANTMLLVQRVQSTNFYFYEKTAAATQWTYVTNIVLATATNDAPMQVGIAQQTQSGVTGTAVVRSFTLDAADVVSGSPSPAAASDLEITLNQNLSMTLDWVAADGSGNPVPSIVVMRASAPVSVQPSLGQPIVANASFGTPATGLGSGNFVVFASSSPASTNNTVTVTGLTPGVTYYAAVYTFAGSGSTATYGPGISSSLPAGFLQQIQATLAGGIPLGGIGQLSVLASYNGVPVNVSATAAVSSGDTNIIKVLNGVLTGVALGSAPITTVFSGMTNVTQITVRAPAFVDSFETSRDYLVAGVAGSGWDGLYSPAEGNNPIPGSLYEPLAGSGTTVADANITTNGALTITSAGDGWENGNVGGFFLYKFVPGDFQAAVKIETFDATAFNQPGLLARGYAVSNSILGLPMGYAVTNADGTNTAGEYWVSLTRFDEFGIGTYARRNIDNAVSQNTQPDANDTNFWMLIIRSQGTNFTFYKRLNETDAWRRVPNNTAYSLLQFAGRPMQVGVMAGPWTGTGGVQRQVQFGSFMLDYSSGAALGVSVSGGMVTLSWGADPNLVLEATDSLTSPNWQTVLGTPTLGLDGYSLTVAISGDMRFFRLRR
ncbi:MAG TPA: hypothetical protein VEH04_09910 [Verrucomicrobiae bacterium]|nr:hypothetical protein [Verrucomicrobiae bacterium]